ARGDDIPSHAEVVAALGDGVVEQLLVRLAALPHPHDVVTPVQAVEGAVEFGQAGAGRVISHASKPMANRKPQDSPVVADLRPKTCSQPCPGMIGGIQRCCQGVWYLVRLLYGYSHTS